MVHIYGNLSTGVTELFTSKKRINYRTIQHNTKERTRENNIYDIKKKRKLDYY